MNDDVTVAHASNEKHSQGSFMNLKDVSKRKKRIDTYKNLIAIMRERRREKYDLVESYMQLPGVRHKSAERERKSASSLK